MKKLLFIFLLSIAGINPVFADITAIKNAGLVPANIWYSKDPFFAGDKIRIYTVIFNGSTYSLAGSMEFLDNGTSLGTKSFTVASKGRVQEMWVDWTATEGTHTITARIAEVHGVGVGGIKIPVTLENTETGKSERSVEISPEAKAVQAVEDAKKSAEEAKKREEIKQELLGKAESAVQVVSDVTLPVRTGALLGLGTLDQFRVNTESTLRVAKEYKEQEIKMIKAEEDASATSTSKKNIQGATDRMLNVAEKPFAYVLLALFTVGQYLFKWQIAFYGIILYVVYRVIRLVIRKVRNR